MSNSPRPTPAGLVVAALVLVQVLFGVHYLAAKVVIVEIPPRAWALLRVSGASGLLLAITLLSRRTLPRGKDWVYLALFSIFGVVINQVCFIEGLSRTTPTHSSLMNTMIPVLTMFFAVIIGQERLVPRKLAALLTALAGVLLIIRPGAETVSRTMQAGDLLTLVNATSYSLFLAVSRRVIVRIDPLAATAILLGFGTVGIAALGLPPLLDLNLGAVSGRAWALGAFIVIGPTAGAYLLMYWALARVESSVVAFFIFLQPVIASTLSVVLLRERPDLPVLAGATLIFAGVYLELRAVRRR